MKFQWACLLALATSTLAVGAAETIPVLVVGSNKTETVTFSGTAGFRGKLIIGDGSNQARGIVYAENGVSITNIASTAGEWLLGRRGYAHLGLKGDSRYMAHGVWWGAQEGRLGISIVNARFSCYPQKTGDFCSFGLGGDDSDVSLYIGEGGVLNGENSINQDVQIPLSRSAASAQVTVEGGTFDVQTAVVKVNKTAVFNVNRGGVFKACRLASASGDAILQFNGGTWRTTLSSVLVDGEIIVQSGGATFDVPYDYVTEVSSISAPAGNGIAAIKVNDTLAEKTFAGPPVVRITSSTGRAGTAVCEFDASTKKVTGFNITGRGTGYTGATVRLYDGYSNPTDLTVSDIEFERGISGDIVKTGTGSLRFNGKSTYTGLLTVSQGTVQLAGTNRLNEASALRLDNNSVFDLMGNEQTLSDLKGDGTGVITNGVLKLTGLVVDMAKVKVNACDILNFANVEFTENARVRLLNVDDLDPAREYVLYYLSGTPPTRIPPIDEQCYGSGLDDGWSVAVKDGKLVLANVGGSMFIYY